MKLRVDVPNNYSFQRYADHEIVQKVYTEIFQAAMRLGLETTISRASSIDDQPRPKAEPDCIHYAYHTQNLGPHSYCIKLGPLTDRWFFDDCGYSGWSRIANDIALQKQSLEYDLTGSKALIEEYRVRFKSEGFSKLEQTPDALENDVAKLSDFVFYPLQVEGDRVLQHLPWEQADTLELLIKNCEKLPYPIVLKKHPFCKSDVITLLLERAAKCPNIYISEASIHDLIDKSSKVLVSNSGVGLEALIHGKQVLSMAQSEYRHLTTKIPTKEKILSILKDKPKRQSNAIKQGIGYLLQEYWVDVHDPSSVEQRLIRHIQEVQSKGKTTAFSNGTLISPSATALRDQLTTYLSDGVDLMVRLNALKHETAKDHRDDIMWRAARMKIKYNLIMEHAEPTVMLKIARSHVHAKEFKAAKAIIERLKKRGEARGQALKILADLLLAKKKTRSAIKALRAATAFPDVKADAFGLLSQQIIKLKDDGWAFEAKEAAMQALQRNPNYGIAHLTLARLAHMTDDHKEAYKQIECALALQPDHVSIVRFAEVLEKHKKAQRLKREQARKSFISRPSTKERSTNRFLPFKTHLCSTQIGRATPAWQATSKSVSRKTQSTRLSRLKTGGRKRRKSRVTFIKRKDIRHGNGHFRNQNQTSGFRKKYHR